VSNLGGSVGDVASSYFSGEQPAPANVLGLRDNLRDYNRAEQSANYLQAAAPLGMGALGTLLGTRWRGHRILGGVAGALLGGTAGALMPLALRGAQSRLQDEINNRIIRG
jgi:hypothetical protein